MKTLKRNDINKCFDKINENVGVNRAPVRTRPSGQARDSGRETFEKENLIKCKIKELNRHPRGVGSDSPTESGLARGSPHCEFSQPMKLPCLRKFPTLLNVPASFDFLTFLSLFRFLPNLSPCNSYCFGYFGNLYWDLAIKAPRQDMVKIVFHFIEVLEGSL